MAQSAARKLRVLWATDGSEAAHDALTLLRQLVLPAAERVVVLSVASHPLISGARIDPQFFRTITPSGRRKALEEAETLSRREAGLLEAPRGVEVEAIALWGHPIEEILRAAGRVRADVIVLGAKGHSNLKIALLGSTSQGVVSHSTRPVLVARPVDEVKSIVVGYDGSRPARRALEFLESLALPPSVEVRPTWVIEPFVVPSHMPVTYRNLAIAEAHKINARRHRRCEQALKLLATKLGASGRRVTTEVLAGPAAAELEDAARKHGAGLIVVGSRKPSAERHYLLGTTAEKLVRHASASVLVVR